MASEVLSSDSESIHSVLGVTKQSLEAYISEEKVNFNILNKNSI